MAPSSKFANWGKDKLLSFSKDPANMLLVTATLGWIFSAAGQLVSIVTNKQISKKEKRFLIPQEGADALINILSFYFVTRSIQNASKKLVSKGKVLTPRIKDFCEKYGVKISKKAEGDVVNIGKDLSAEIDRYKAVLDVQKDGKGIKLDLSEGQIKDIEKKVKILSHFKDEVYTPFENGLGVVGNVLGAVVSGNIITPILRNPMAAYKQRTSMEQEKLEQDAKLYNDNKVVLAQNDVDKKNTINRTAANAYPKSGAMKV